MITNPFLSTIPIEEEDTNFMSAFEARNTQNTLPIASTIPDCFTQDTNTFTPNY